MEGHYRDPDSMGQMPFSRTLEDWARFDINNRTMFDASISSGLAIMANMRHTFIAEKQIKPISVRIPTYSNSGSQSTYQREV